MKKLSSIQFVFLILALLLTACSSTLTKSPLPSIEPTMTEEPTPTEETGQLYVRIDEDQPGSTPEPFGESFFSGSFHSSPVFVPNGKTVWWGGEYGAADIYTSQWTPSGWTEPETITFSDAIFSYRDPFVSPDGSRLYFISTADVPGLPSKENLWMVEKIDAGWSEPQPLPESINALALHWTVSVTEDYDLYFSANEDGNTDIFLSRFIDGAYTDPVRLDAPVNTEYLEITPNIAPDGSYLLFSRVESTQDPPYLFITYAQDSGWSEPVKIENISYCISPIVTPDRAFVIYMSSPSSFAWRDTSFIEELRP
jgi:Tol biopolymer transport system component